MIDRNILLEANLVITVKNGKITVVKNRNGSEGEVSFKEAVKLLIEE